MDREALFTAALLIHGHPPDDAASQGLTNYQLNLVAYFMECGVKEMWMPSDRRGFLMEFFSWYYVQERNYA